MPLAPNLSAPGHETSPAIACLAGQGPDKRMDHGSERRLHARADAAVGIIQCRIVQRPGEPIEFRLHAAQGRLRAGPPGVVVRPGGGSQQQPVGFPVEQLRQMVQHDGSEVIRFENIIQNQVRPVADARDQGTEKLPRGTHAIRPAIGGAQGGGGLAGQCFTGEEIAVFCLQHSYLVGQVRGRTGACKGRAIERRLHMQRPRQIGGARHLAAREIDFQAGGGVVQPKEIEGGPDKKTRGQSQNLSDRQSPHCTPSVIRPEVAQRNCQNANGPAARAIAFGNCRPRGSAPWTPVKGKPLKSLLEGWFRRGAKEVFIKIRAAPLLNQL